MLLDFHGKSPIIAEKAWVAKTADLIGDVTLGTDTSVWFCTVIRADINSVKIGERCSIQDGTVIHVDEGFPTIIGNDVTIGHKAMLHGCTIGDGCLIGMGSIILDGAEIGAGSIVAAGSVVTPGKKFPAGSMLMGTPAKIVKQLSKQEQDHFLEHAAKYVNYKDEYLKMEK